MTGPEVLLHSWVLGQGLRLWGPLFRAWGAGHMPHLSFPTSEGASALDHQTGLAVHFGKQINLFLDLME